MKNEEDRLREALRHGMSFNPGWCCRNCKKWHGPHIDTCPNPTVDNRPLRERIKVENG
jgi:hypothetical protein